MGFGRGVWQGRRQGGACRRGEAGEERHINAPVHPLSRGPCTASPCHTRFIYILLRCCSWAPLSMALVSLSDGTIDMRLFQCTKTPLVPPLKTHFPRPPPPFPLQLDTAERGFSFLRDGPIDMRMDPGAKLSAEEVRRGDRDAGLDCSDCEEV